MFKNKALKYSFEKNELLKQDRDIGFEDIILSIENGYLLDDFEHPNKDRYPNQNIFVILVMVKDYVYFVPYIENENEIFLKTIVPSRKLNQKYNKKVNNETR